MEFWRLLRNSGKECFLDQRKVPRHFQPKQKSNEKDNSYKKHKGEDDLLFQRHSLLFN